MIELFTWPTPNGRKASIALEEFELDYEVRAVDITKDEQFAPTFLNISPNNKIPALVDHESGRTLMESGAILIYLADRCERFWGEDRYQTIEWLMLQMGGVGPMLGQAHHFLKYKGPPPSIFCLVLDTDNSAMKLPLVSIGLTSMPSCTLEWGKVFTGL